MKKIEEEEVKKSHVLSLEGTLSWTDNPESTDSSEQCSQKDQRLSPSSATCCALDKGLSHVTSRF